MGEAGERRRTDRGRSARARIETSAGGVVYRRVEPGLEFLLIRDPYGNWGLPKGHVEEEETLADTARREVEEETGLALLDIEHDLPRIDWYFRQRGRLIHKYCHFFLMRCSGGRVTPATEEGISSCVWLSFDDATRTISYDNAREVLRAAGRMLGLEISGGADPTD